VELCGEKWGEKVELGGDEPAIGLRKITFGVPDDYGRCVVLCGNSCGRQRRHRRGRAGGKTWSTLPLGENPRSRERRRGEKSGWERSWKVGHSNTDRAVVLAAVSPPFAVPVTPAGMVALVVAKSGTGARLVSQLLGYRTHRGGRAIISKIHFNSLRRLDYVRCTTCVFNAFGLKILAAITRGVAANITKTGLQLKTTHVFATAYWGQNR
jgi:hypothetical protein